MLPGKALSTPPYKSYLANRTPIGPSATLALIGDAQTNGCSLGAGLLL